MILLDISALIKAYLRARPTEKETGMERSSSSLSLSRICGSSPAMKSEAFCHNGNNVTNASGIHSRIVVAGRWGPTERSGEQVVHLFEMSFGVSGPFLLSKKKTHAHTNIQINV